MCRCVYTGVFVQVCVCTGYVHVFRCLYVHVCTGVCVHTRFCIYHKYRCARFNEMLLTESTVFSEWHLVTKKVTENRSCDSAPSRASKRKPRDPLDRRREGIRRSPTSICGFRLIFPKLGVKEVGSLRGETQLHLCLRPLRDLGSGEVGEPEGK